MEKLAGFLLISGSGRKVGKTSLACEMIEKYHARGVVALKIAPHFHDLPDISQIMASGEGFRIIKETQNTQKDSSRMLQAGAVKSYYVQSIDKAIPKVLAQLEPEIGGRPVVCESGGLARFCQPALHVFIFDYLAGLQNLPDGVQPDFLLPSYEGQAEFPFERLGLSNGIWVMR